MSSFESAATKRAMKLFEKFNDALTGSLPSKMARKRGELSVLKPGKYLRRSAEVTRSSSTISRDRTLGLAAAGGSSPLSPNNKGPLPEHLREISACQIKGKCAACCSCVRRSETHVPTLAGGHNRGQWKAQDRYVRARRATE